MPRKRDIRSRLIAAAKVLINDPGFPETTLADIPTRLNDYYPPSQEELQEDPELRRLVMYERKERREKEEYEKKRIAIEQSIKPIIQYYIDSKKTEKDAPQVEIMIRNIIHD